jgi:Ca-activated chloride channel homolog
MRSWRVTLAAAALLGIAALASEAVRAGEARQAWSDLWQRPDQQGQALLDAGEPALAAGRFHDPRRRAYADLEAGRNAAAAKLLAPFSDPESEYNRGNALARSGELEAALAAYDAALKQAPWDRDIRHNRDLVARALERARQSTPRSGQNGRQSGSSGARSQPAGAGRQSGSGSPGSRQSGNGPQPSGGASRPSGGKPRQSGGNSKPSGDSAQPATAGADSEQQAKRDAAMAAALARRPPKPGSPGNTGQARSSADGADLLGGTRTPPQKPETERQLALDQWLRQIPDSPAGLLRRKFLIEHMMRQEESANSGGGD